MLVLIWLYRIYSHGEYKEVQNFYIENVELINIEKNFSMEIFLNVIFIAWAQLHNMSNFKTHMMENGIIQLIIHLLIKLAFYS